MIRIRQQFGPNVVAFYYFNRKITLAYGLDERLNVCSQSAVINQLQGQKTRMRTSFDTELELPKLQAWFAENPHPSRQQVSVPVDCRAHAVHYAIL